VRSLDERASELNKNKKIGKLQNVVLITFIPEKLVGELELF
jgi:hypothetical protein